MSAIDTFNHVHVGMFCNLPVYWILEEEYKILQIIHEMKKNMKNLLTIFFI